MILGVVSARREAVIRLEMVGLDGVREEIEAVLDTGFNGDVALPLALAARLGLPRRGQAEARLADGGVVPLDLFNLAVIWDSRSRDIIALGMGSVPLVGMGLLLGHRLTIDAIDGGPVVIESLA